MRCPKCNQEISNNQNICPQCHYELKKSSVRISRSIKSKINELDKSSLVGGTVSRGAFIKLEKKVPKKDIVLKDYNNYIDYKAAKEKEQTRLNNQKTKRILKSPIVDHIVNSETQNSSSTKYIEVTPHPQKQPFINIVSVNKKHSITPNAFNIFAYIIVITLWIFSITLIINNTRTNYYFHEDEAGQIEENSNNTTVDDEMLKYNGVSKSGQTAKKSSEGITSIIYDNQYTKQFTIANEYDVIRLIRTDSVKQKESCPANIIQIENEIIENYGITAVNLCEMDYAFAREIADVVKYIYREYPSARNYLTNLTLANVDKNQTFMAAFMPIFTFATSNTSSGYPVGVKTQILLNAKYFLNTSKIRTSVNYGARSGYFPPNATRSSTVAHEFGHYLSYVALLNYYNSKQLNFVKSSNSSTLYKVYDNFNAGEFSYNLLVEAYELYKREYPYDSFEQFRRSISTYAMAKDSSGKYIYDETIAESFHDVYLNGNNAKPASIYIVKVLEQKLRR